MKPYLKRLAQLHHKTKSGQVLTDHEASELRESLTANMKSKTNYFAYEVTLAYLWGLYRGSGQLCQIERMLWGKAMDQNLDRYLELCQQQQLANFAHQIGDDNWEESICQRIDELNGFKKQSKKRMD